MKTVSGFQSRIFARLSRHASTSMSGGGVGGSVNTLEVNRNPAVSPAQTTPLRSSK
jgi:hypothetical protein